MAFNTALGRAEYIASEGQTVFDFVFKLFNTDELKVYLTPVGNSANDNDDLLTLSTDYTITINGDNGGTVTLISGATAGDSIVLSRELPTLRNYEYQEAGDLRAVDLNADQDYQTYLIQQNKQFETRFLKPQDSSTTFDNVLPPFSDGYFKYNNDGTGIEIDNTIPDQVTEATTQATNSANSAIEASGYATNASDSADLAERWANEAEDTQVTLGNYSAFHWAKKAEALGNIDAYLSDTPILSGVNSANELTDVTITIDNYTASGIYTISVTGGSFTRVGDTITWTLPEVTADTVYTITAWVSEVGKLSSQVGSKGVNVVNIPLIDDDTIQVVDIFNDLSSNTGFEEII
jgi:hypothetical protein